MGAASITVTVGKGDSLVVNATHEVSASDTTPVNISGWTIAVDIRQHVGDQSVLLTLAATVVSGPAGTYTFTFTHAQTLALWAGDFAISIFRTDVGSEREMAVGTLTVEGNARYGS